MEQVTEGKLGAVQVHMRAWDLARSWSACEKEGESQVGQGGDLPVCGIFGLPFATKSTVTAVGPVAEEGFLPRHVCDHLVQVQEPSLGCSYTCQAAKQRRHAVCIGVTGGPWGPGVGGLGLGGEGRTTVLGKARDLK